MTQKALLVGINAYPGCPLRGCLNDVQQMATFLTKRCGFDASDIRLLTDGRATTKEILERLNWLTLGAKAGDRLFFHFSGHGTQLALRDVSGRVDILHDCVCPVDFDFSRERALLDTDFTDCFKNIPENVTFNWVSDSCHSGDLTRTFNCATRYRMSRSYPVPVDIGWRTLTAQHTGLLSRELVDKLKHLHLAFISGCASDQTSADAEINNTYHGALTYYLVQALETSGGLDTPLSELVPKVNQALETNGYEQDPQLRGEEFQCLRPWMPR